MRHPYIVDLYEIIETPKFIYIFMEFASNGELFTYIQKKKKLSEQEASRIFAQLLLGIEYIHQMGIVHRDLKPENLLLGHDFRIKIADFGLSNIYRKGEQLKTACGSPCYAAPEMVSGKIYDGKTVDTWSCGVILYTLLCGCLPFEARSTNQVYDKILLEDFSKPRHLSKDALSMLEKILDKDPNTRIKIPDIKKHPFFVNHNHNLKPSVGIIVGKDRIPIDESLVQHIAETLSYPASDMRKSVEANSQNTHTTTYKLLLKKWLISGNDSIYDINSDKFEPSLLKKTQVRSESMDIFRNKAISIDKHNTKTCLQILQRNGGAVEEKSSILTHISVKDPDTSLDIRRKKAIPIFNIGPSGRVDKEKTDKERVYNSKASNSGVQDSHGKLEKSRTDDRASIILTANQINVEKGQRNSQKNNGSRNGSNKRKESLGKKVNLMIQPALLPKIDSKENSKVYDHSLEVVLLL